MQTAHSSTCRTGGHPESEIRMKSLAVCKTGNRGSRNRRASDLNALAFSTTCETTSMALTAQQQQTQMIRSLRQPIVAWLVPIKQELRIRVEATGARRQQTLGAQAALRLHRARMTLC